jgi:hypothetical protein
MEQAVTHPGIHQPTSITQVHTVLNIHSKYVVQDGTIPFSPKVLQKLTKLFQFRNM